MFALYTSSHCWADKGGPVSHREDVRIIHEDVHSSEGSNHRLSHLHGLIVAGEVTKGDVCHSSGLPDGICRALGTLRVSPMYNHDCALRRQHTSKSRPNAAVAPCHKSMLAHKL
jgi:hypothetical protein